MAMNSMEEDALFEEYGWWKDLIGRRFISPGGQEITFDQLMEHTLTPEGEQYLVSVVRAHGERQ